MLRSILKTCLVVSLFSVLLYSSAWSRGGGGCFLPETLILRNDGTSIAIKQIKPGDQIEAYDADGKFISSTVHAVFTHEVNAYFILTTNKVVLNVTGEHPLYIGNGEFKTVESLAAGDVIYAYDGNKLGKQYIASIRRINAAATVYNLQTNEPHTYFAAGIAVHNKGGGGGGGGGFHGGSYSSGSSSGSSCAKGDIVCEITSVLAFIIVCIFVIVGKLFSHKKDLDYLNSRANIERKSIKTVTLMNFLAKQDVSVLPDHLIQKTQDVFLQLQQCWSNRDYTPMKTLMMPDIYKQHCGQIQGMIRNHEINMMKDLHIIKIDLVNIRYTEKEFQREFTALITASVADYYIDDRNNKFLRGSKSSETFQEFWTFELEPDGWRLRDIEQSRESDYLKEENFVEMFTDLQIKKIYGDKVDNLGTEGPWLPKAVAQKENKVDRMLNFLSKSNQMWDRQFIVTRVRSVFTQVHMALEAGKLDIDTENVLFPDVAKQLKETLDAWRAAGNAIEYRNFCVRKVEIVLVKSFDDKAKNEFTARVSAHAQIVHLKNNAILTKDDDVTLFIEYWEFGQLDNEWKLKEAKPQSENDILNAENIEEGSSPNLVKWYYTRKRAI